MRLNDDGVKVNGVWMTTHINEMEHKNQVPNHQAVYIMKHNYINHPFQVHDFQ